MIIIGIDPGTATTGYGVIRVKVKNKPDCLDYGIIETDRLWTQEKRLKKIHIEISKLLREYKPDVLMVEKVFFFKNLKTALPVSEAIGVILLTAAKKNIPVERLTPLQVKMNITGYGRATKKEVQEKVKKILKLKEIPKPDDAADALAIAICYTTLIKR